MLSQDAGAVPRTTATGNNGSTFFQQHKKQQLTNDIPPLPTDIQIRGRPRGHAATCSGWQDTALRSTNIYHHTHRIPKR